MYQKRRYIKKNPEYIYDFICKHPFATFVLKGRRLLGTHIPILAEGEAQNFRLFGHISNEYNEQIDHLEDDREALLIFHGPQAYISSSWYKRKNISTWDYSAIHVNVRLQIQSREELVDSLKKMVKYFEDKQDNPLYYNEIPKNMIEDQLPLITGFWAKPFHIEATAKLHQGYRDEDVESVVDHLRKKEDPYANLLGKEIEKENKK